MGLPIKAGAGAVVIDQARIAKGWTALHPVAESLERLLSAQPQGRQPLGTQPHRNATAADVRLERPETKDARRTRGDGADRTEWTDRTGQQNERSSPLADAEHLLQQLQELGRSDLPGLERFLSRHPTLAAALEAAGADDPASIGALSSAHAHGIPNDKGWA